MTFPTFLIMAAVMCVMALKALVFTIGRLSVIALFLVFVYFAMRSHISSHCQIENRCILNLETGKRQ